MQCPCCKSENAEAAKFCGECGAKLELRCAGCGAANPAVNKFCLECGQPLAAAEPKSTSILPSPQEITPRHLAQKILAARNAMQRERKQVTVLFADVSGFTSISEKLDPEEAHQFMQRCFDRMVEPVHRYEGTITQFLGDGFMALFGAPIAHEDHAQRAVRAALDIEPALKSYQEELWRTKGIELRVRCGLNTGLVVVGTISDNLQMEYTAMGDTVNLASRMLNVGGLGQIIVAEDTHKAVSGYFVTRALGKQAVKGKADPVNAYEVLRAREFRTRIDVELERGFSPFVGREKELALLQERFGEAKSGRGQIVFEIGEAGVGKSRLHFEFRRSLEEETYSWLTGRCISFGAQIPYLPVIDIVKRYLHVEEGDDESTVITKTEQCMSALGDELRLAIPYFKQLLSVNPGDDAVTKMDAQIRRLKTFEALRALIWKLAETKPLVLVVEDLHWMDKASEDLLLYLADSCTAARVLLILTHRPGYQNPFGDRSYATRQVLNRLSDEESIRLAEGMLATSDFPSELRGLITRKAEGNPFFVEEVIKSLLEIGALERQNGHYVATKNIAEIYVPDTIQDVIMGRIDRLEDSPKKALQLASVIGREFTVSLLERISDLKGQLGKLLQDLKLLELIYERSLFPELAFMFKHALTQDVAYNSLLIQRRKDLHRLVATAIEELYAERLAEYYEMLAYHYERGEVWEKAFNYLVKAGEKSQRASANQEAIAQFNRALEISTKLAQTADRAELLTIYLGKGAVHTVLSEFLVSVEAYQNASAVARQTGDHFREVQALALMGFSFLWAHEFEKCLECANQARALALERGYKDLLAFSFLLTGSTLAFTGKLAEAVQQLEEALTNNKEAGDDSTEATVRQLLGLLSSWIGDFPKALEFHTQSIASSQAHDFQFMVLINSFTQGLTQCGRGEYDQAIAILVEGLALSHRLGDKVFKCRILNSLGWVYGELYNLEPAIRYNTEALEASYKLGDPETIRNAEVNLGEYYLDLGDLEQAQRYLEKVYRDSQQRGKWGEEWMKWRYMQHCCHSLGELWLKKGDSEKALAFAEECLKLAEPTQSRKNIVKGWRLKGQAFLAQGKLAEAEAGLNKAIIIAKEIGNPPQLWKTYQALGELHERKGEREAARTAHCSAIQVIEETAARLADQSIKENFLSAPQVKAIRQRLEVLGS